MAVNPFLIPLMLALGDIDSFDELAQLLLAGHFSVGHATGFGKLIDEKVLPKVFNTVKLDSKFRKKLPWSRSMFDEIDHLVTMSNGDVYLLCLKAGRWTIQLTMAVQLNKAFVDILKARAAGEVEFAGIVTGVFYGRTETLTDKYDIIRGINRGATHDVTDVQNDVQVYTGRGFWSWLNGNEEATQEWVLEGILCGIEIAKIKCGSISSLMDAYKTQFATNFAQYVDQNRTVDWLGVLHMING
jgi:hypothetical protein